MRQSLAQVEADDLQVFLGVEADLTGKAGEGDEAAVDLGDGGQHGGVVALQAAAVDHVHAAGLLLDEAGNFGDVGLVGRGLAGADNYYMKVQDYHTSVPAADFPCPQVFAPGSYTLSVFNLPEGMERADNRVGVASLPDGTLLPQPGVLYGNAATIGIAADDTLAVTLPMKQLTRRLTLKMKLAGGNPGILAGTEASITGIAPALDIAALKLQGDPATVRPVFVREGDVLTAELNLLGTAADVRQEFIIVLIATDGQRQTLARDMTGALSDFNRGTDPMTLDATLELMNDALPDADITDWVPSGSEEGDAV